jgi:hypothetical protein
MSDELPQVHGTAKSYERELTHSRHVIANAKLVVTFSAAIAGTFVATALQGEDKNWLDEVASGLMLLTLLFTFAVVAFPPRHHKHDLGDLTDSAFEALQRRTRKAYGLMVTQVVLSVLASAAAAVGLLNADWHWWTIKQS